MTMMNRNTIILLVSGIAGLARADAGLPDPTRPADYSVARVIKEDISRQRTEFSVNAIRISGTDRSAIINGKIVRVGDDIGTAKVKAINTMEVVLNYERKLMVVPLYARGISKQFKTSEVKD